MTFPSDTLLGADRPFRYDLGTLWEEASREDVPHNGVLGDGKRLVYWEKSGPAFTSTKEQLMNSLQAQVLKAAGEVLNALGSNRRCFLDVMPAWTRLLKILGLTIPVYRSIPRKNWEFEQMREDVTLALCYSEQIDTPEGLVKWGTADAVLRGYARDAAESIESRLSLDDMNYEMLAHNLAEYRKFSEGR